MSPSETPNVSPTTSDEHSKDKERKRERKQKFVPWEPYKAAPSHDRKGCEPEHIPTLIPYTTREPPTKDNGYHTGPTLCDERKKKQTISEGSDEGTTALIRQLTEEKTRLGDQLQMEIHKNEELRRVLKATVDDDLMCHVDSLTQDKVRLARTLEDYAKRIVSDDDTCDALRIQSDMWRVKFLAMAIRVDEEGTRAEHALAIARAAQRVLAESVPYLPPSLAGRARDISTRQLAPLYNRSPCDEKVCHRGPRFNNLTIGCCKNCQGKEIYLL